MPTDKITISRGAQFRGGKTAYLFLVTVALICLTGAMIAEGEFFIAVVSLITAILSLYFVLDVQGIEIDLKKKGLRHYRIRPWGRDGEWRPLADFRAVEVDHERYVVKIRSAYQLGDVGGRIIRERHWRFTVCLVGDLSDARILLMETKDIKGAVVFAQKTATKLQLPVIDRVKRHFQEQMK